MSSWNVNLCLQEFMCHWFLLLLESLGLIKCTDMCGLECTNMAAKDELNKNYDNDEDEEDDYWSN